MEAESPAAQLFSQCIVNFTAEPSTHAQPELHNLFLSLNRFLSSAIHSLRSQRVLHLNLPNTCFYRILRQVFVAHFILVEFLPTGEGSAENMWDWMLFFPKAKIKNEMVEPEGDRSNTDGQISCHDDCGAINTL